MSRWGNLAFLAVLVAGAPAAALELPPVCAEYPGGADAVTPIPQLRMQVETAFESDPALVVGLLCGNIPRVEREYGAESAELAWWIGSLATPLIAYLDRHDEAIPLLDFALPLFQRHLGPYSSEVSDVHVAHAWINFRKGLLHEAGEAWERALAVREHNPGIRQIELQKVLVGLAQVRLSQRAFGAARQALDRASVILTVNGETVSEAAAAIENAYTNLALREEHYDLARRHSERQLEIERQLDRTSAQLVPAQVIHAQILEHLDEYEAAEAALRQAVTLAEADQDTPLQRHQMTALTQLAATLSDRGKPREAVEFASRALAVGQTTLGADAPRLLRVLDTRAEAHRALGDLPAALADYRRADEILLRHAADVERPVQVAHHRGKGALLTSLGDPEGAKDALRAALEVAGDDATLTHERGLTLLALGRLAGVQTQARRLEQLTLARSLLVTRLPGSHPDILRVVNELCGMQVNAGRAPACDEAAALFGRARTLEPALATVVLAHQSRRAEASGDRAAAYTLAIDALGSGAALATPDPQWRALIRLAELIEARGDARLAIFLGKRAIVEIERLRGYLGSSHRRFEPGFLADKTGVYRTVADWLFAAGRVDEGLELLSLLRTEELHDFVLRNQAPDAAPGDPDAAAQRVSFSLEEQGLLRSFRALQAGRASAGAELERLSRIRESGRISADERARLESLVARHASDSRLQAHGIQRWLESAALQTFIRPRATPLRSSRIERIRERFGDDTAFAAYLLTDSHLRMVIATSAGLEQRAVPLEAGALHREIGRLLDAIATRGEVGAASRALFATLLAPVVDAAAAAGARRLVLWPDGVLRYVPFAALRNGDRYVADIYPVQIYADSEHLPDRGGTRKGNILGLAVTRAVEGYPALPAMADELCSIIAGPIRGSPGATETCGPDGIGRGAVAGEGYVDSMFTRQRLVALQEGDRPFSLLHLGTHFELRPGNALRSTLLLGDGTRLSLDEIARLDFRGLELVTLSACQTGIGAVLDDGREIEGLSAVVQRLGARRVIASLWSVEDKSTARLMRNLYTALATSGGDAAFALNEAIAGMRELPDYQHPYYWAGFFVSGAGR